MSYHRSKEFKQLEKEWYDKLAKSGFEDIEDSHGCLKSQDKRTIAYQNQIQIRDFFLNLDTLLSHDYGMPKFDRRVLELFSEGVYIKVIAKKVRRSDRTVRSIINRYKALIDTFNRIQEMATHFRFSTHMNAERTERFEGDDEARTNPDQAA